MLILDFLQALQHQEFQKAETLMNETLQNQGGRANLLPFHQRKILTSKAGENVLFVLSENGTSQDVAYLIQKVFIQDHMLVMEPLYTLYILQPSFKNPTPSLSEQQEKCRQRYLEDQTIEKNVLRKENVLNTLNSYLDEETSINLCTAFFAYYSQHTYENVNAATIIGFTGYEATAKERFDTRYSFSFVPPEPNSTFAEIYQAIRL
ncbi:MAG: hypothetical protein LBP53_04260 [Candidatus Peribacteria bacterium]|nr:hypothetical protein [Candidatus Peribacteria bacterium]